MSAVIEFEAVTKRFGERVAVEDASFALLEGRTLGLVGESGSGKTTCVRLALGLEQPTAGVLRFRGSPYPTRPSALKPIRRQVGFVFQDPYDSLDPRMTLREIVAEPLRTHRAGGRDVSRRVAEMLAAVGLPDAPLSSYPSRYSGGGRQRIAIARALILDPDVLLCDEPTASLDVSVQAQIINLLLEMKRARSLSVVFVSHDLDLIKRVADDIVVMYAGRVVEAGDADVVGVAPRHPYSRALLEAIPADHPRRRHLTHARSGATTVAAHTIDRGACVYASRCERVQEHCRTERPELEQAGVGSACACWFPVGEVAGAVEMVGQAEERG